MVETRLNLPQSPSSHPAEPEHHALGYYGLASLRGRYIAPSYQPQLASDELAGIAQGLREVGSGVLQSCGMG